jgi:hypothetical protein
MALRGVPRLQYTLLGVAHAAPTGEPAFLILDPHYTGAGTGTRTGAEQAAAVLAGACDSIRISPNSYSPCFRLPISLIASSRSHLMPKARAVRHTRV